MRDSSIGMIELTKFFCKSPLEYCKYYGCWHSDLLLWNNFQSYSPNFETIDKNSAVKKWSRSLTISGLGLFVGKKMCTPDHYLNGYA